MKCENILSIASYAVVAFGLSMISANPIGARESGFGHNCLSCHTLSEQEAVRLLKPLNLKVKSVRQSPVSGLFEVLADREGKEGIIYVDFGKKLLMQGVIIEAAKLQSADTNALQPDRKSSP